jgi:hypothetical protein
MTPEEWVEFHKQLDEAVAELCTEGHLPSQVTLMDFMNYSAVKAGFIAKQPNKTWLDHIKDSIEEEKKK